MLSAVALSMQVDPVQAAQLTVGQSAPLTGPASTIGKAVTQAAHAYFARANAEGKLKGHVVRLVDLDDEFKPDRTLGNAKDLIQREGVVALLNVVGAPNNGNLHTSGLLPKHEVSVVGAFTGSTSVRALKSPYLHFIRAGVADEARLICRQLSAMGISRVALLHADDAFGRDALEQMKAQGSKHGLDLVQVGSYAPASVDVKPVVDRLLVAPPQAVVIFGTGLAASEFIRLFRSGGGGGLIVASSAVSAKVVVDKVGMEMARGVGIVQVVPSLTRRQLPIVADYVDTLKRYGPPAAVPDSAGLEGFIAAKVLGMALSRAGTEPTRASVHRALQGMGAVDVGGLIVDLSTDRTLAPRFVEIGIIGEGGRLRN